MYQKLKRILALGAVIIILLLYAATFVLSLLPGNQAKDLLDKMGGKVLDVQKAHLVELIQAAEKVVEEEKSDEYYDNTQILLKAIKVGEAAIELRDSCSEAEEVYEGRDVNEVWAS